MGVDAVVYRLATLQMIQEDMTDKKIFQSKGFAFKVTRGCSVLFSCNTMAMSKIPELRGDKYMGNRVFLEVLPLTYGRCCCEVPPSTTGQRFCEVSPFLLHLCCSCFPALPLQTRCSSFQPDPPYDGGASASEKCQSQKTT